MLLQFTVENYKSFKDRIVLSMEASSDKEHLNNTVLAGSDRLLKTATIFGANASGKTNVFGAIVAGILTIKNSNTSQYNDNMPWIVPYKFDKKTCNLPTAFEFIFYGKDLKKYIYGYAADKSRIYSEYLYKYTSAKKSLIFDRDTLREVEFEFRDPKVKKNLNPLTEKNTKNKLFLSTATSWNALETREAYNYLSSCISVMNDDTKNLIPYALSSYEADSDNSVKNFTTKLMNKADINISDYDIKSREISAQAATTVGADKVGDVNTSKEFSVNILHEVLKSNKSLEKYNLDLHAESKGTIDLFFLSPILKDALDNGKVICIDEFGSNFHPFLVKYLVKMFLDKKINKNKAQLIFSSHDLDILSLKYLRRDQFYFTEKNNLTGVSELFSLDEFSPRKAENIRRSYMMGRFGAVPEIDEEIIEW